jgi:cation diffusion facilitator family transporter
MPFHDEKDTWIAAFHEARTAIAQVLLQPAPAHPLSSSCTFHNERACERHPKLGFDLMASRGSKKVIYAALLANVAIAVLKYGAAALTRSSAMLAEAIHSTVDIGNELLLLLGIKRSSRPPDSLHPYGHGKVLYFYSLLVAVYIFGLGGCVAIYEGISRLRHATLPSNVAWNYAVLGFAAAFEFSSWQISYRELKSRKDPNESLLEEIMGSKDPTVFTVFLEDSAGLIGALLALLAVFLGKALGNPYLDPAASIAIGILLASVAVLLARETGALLVGERTNRGRIHAIHEIIRADPAVERLGQVLTMQLGPQQALLTVEVKFRRGLDLQQLEAAVERIKGSIREKEPTMEKIFIEPDSLPKSPEPRSRAA